MFNDKKFIKDLSHIYEDRYAVITSNDSGLKGTVGKIISLFFDPNRKDRIMCRMQLTPGPFPYDGVEKLKAPSHEECFCLEDIKLIESMINEKPKVYIVCEEWDVRGEASVDMTVFTNKESAEIFKNHLIYKESDRDGLIYRIKMSAWNEAKEIHELQMSDCYICGIQDESNTHYKVTIKEEVVLV